jgi:hypothetical protein
MVWNGAVERFKKKVDVAKSGSSVAMNYSLSDIPRIQNSQYYYLSLSYLNDKKNVHLGLAPFSRRGWHTKVVSPAEEPFVTIPC